MVPWSNIKHEILKTTIQWTQMEGEVTLWSDTAKIHEKEEKETKRDQHALCKYNITNESLFWCTLTVELKSGSFRRLLDKVWLSCILQTNFYSWFLWQLQHKQALLECKQRNRHFHPLAMSIRSRKKGYSFFQVCIWEITIVSKKTEWEYLCSGHPELYFSIPVISLRWHR
jgi:hypothetical protein